MDSHWTLCISLLFRSISIDLCCIFLFFPENVLGFFWILLGAGPRWHRGSLSFQLIWRSQVFSKAPVFRRFRRLKSSTEHFPRFHLSSCLQGAKGTKGLEKFRFFSKLLVSSRFRNSFPDVSNFHQKLGSGPRFR